MNAHGFPLPVSENYKSAQRMLGIVDSDLTAREKAVALMEEAVLICHLPDPAKTDIKQGNIFAPTDISKKALFTHCTNYFYNIVVAGKNQQNDFDPLEMLRPGVDNRSAYSASYTISKQYKKEFPKLKKFGKIIREVFPKETAYADALDKQWAKEAKLMAKHRENTAEKTIPAAKHAKKTWRPKEMDRYTRYLCQ